MTLRSRLLVSVGVILVVMMAAGVSVTMAQRRYLTDQLDRQLTPLVRNLAQARSPLGRLPRGVAPRLPSDVFAARVNADGTLSDITAATSDPDLVPAVSNTIESDRFITLDTVSGSADSVRAYVFERADGQRWMVGISTESVDRSIRRLVVGLSIGGLVIFGVVLAVVFWVIRLGLRPIGQMTVAADRIAAGDRDLRVPELAGNTEAARLGRALNVMIDVNAASEQRLRRFVADASHELRTPLTTLRGYSSLYENNQTADPADTRDAFRRIHDEANRMTRIVDDLFLLAEFDEHRVVIEQVKVDLVPIIENIAADVRVIAPEREIEVHAPTHAFVLGDPQRLTQAIMAYTSNALRYTGDDTAVTISAGVVGAHVRVSVTDTGAGIAAEHLPRIFDRFYRVDAGRARSSGGNGLGLAIVASIVEGHGGRFGVDSQPGRGSTFWFEVPAYE